VERESVVDTLGKLFSPSLRWTTYCLLVMTLAINSGWYGLILWIPTLFKQVGYSQGSIYSSALLVACSNLPGNLIALLLIDRPEVGRKGLYVGSMLLAAGLALVLGFSEEKGVVVAAAMGYNMVSVGAWNSLEVLMAEVYPTEVRSIASGALHSCGRVGSLVAQLADGALLKQGVPVLLAVNAGLMLMGCAGGCLLPAGLAGATLSDRVGDDD